MGKYGSTNSVSEGVKNCIEKINRRNGNETVFKKKPNRHQKKKNGKSSEKIKMRKGKKLRQEKLRRTFFESNHPQKNPIKNRSTSKKRTDVVDLRNGNIYHSSHVQKDRHGAGEFPVLKATPKFRKIPKDWNFLFRNFGVDL